MKHHLSSVRRSPWLRVACLLILALMCAPAAMAATVGGTAALSLPVASGVMPGAMLAAGAGVGLMMLRAPEQDGGEGGGGGGGGDTQATDPFAAIETAKAAMENKTLPMSQRFSVAMKAFAGVGPTTQFAAVQAELTTTKATLATKEAELKTAQDELTAARADVATLEAANAKLETENAALQAKEQDIEKRAAAKSKEHVAALGFPAGQLPASTQTVPDEVAADEKALSEALAKPGLTFAQQRDMVRAFDEKRLAEKK